MFYQFEKWEFVACSNRQFEYAAFYMYYSTNHLFYFLFKILLLSRSSLCQRLSLPRSVRNKPQAWSASVECKVRVSSTEGFNARSFAKQTDTSSAGKALAHKSNAKP